MNKLSKGGLALGGAALAAEGLRRALGSGARYAPSVRFTIYFSRILVYLVGLQHLVGAYRSPGQCVVEARLHLPPDLVHPLPADTEFPSHCTHLSSSRSSLMEKSIIHQVYELLLSKTT